MERFHSNWRYVFIGVLAMILASPALAYDPWKESGVMEIPKSTTQISVNRNVQDVPVFHIVQDNCIFVESEVDPGPWANKKYKQSECSSVRDQREQESQQQNPPKGTKIWHVPANQYFKIHMEVSSNMSHRSDEWFGIQIIDEGNSNVFTEGGWRPGDKKLSKALKLKPGKYYWRCPQNPTVWYGLLAEP